MFGFELNLNNVFKLLWCACVERRKKGRKEELIHSLLACHCEKTCEFSLSQVNLSFNFSNKLKHLKTSLNSVK